MIAFFHSVCYKLTLRKPRGAATITKSTSIDNVRPPERGDARRRRTVLDRLRGELRHVGTEPFGTCFQQAVANVLEAHGLDDAYRRIGYAWGFRWDGGSAALRDGGRTWRNVGLAHGAAIETSWFDSAEEADAAERAALADGRPVVVAVDSFHLDTPYRGREHLAHALITLCVGEQSVTVVDAMNAPQPHTLSRDRYSVARSAPCADRFRLYDVARSPAEPDDERGLAVLAEDLGERWDEALHSLDAYLEALPARERDADLADVAAERLATARALGRVAEIEPNLASASRGMAALARRWYLAHGVAREWRDGKPVREGRLVRMIADLRERELRQREALASTLDAHRTNAAAA